MRIICIDNDMMSLKLLEKSIKSVFPTVSIHTFSSAIQALACNDKIFDVAFIAPELPDIRQYDLVQRLRELNEKINVIFISNYSDYEHEALRIHASGFQHKPISPSKIRYELNNLLYAINETAN